MVVVVVVVVMMTPQLGMMEALTSPLPRTELLEELALGMMTDLQAKPKTLGQQQLLLELALMTKMKMTMMPVQASQASLLEPQLPELIMALQPSQRQTVETSPFTGLVLVLLSTPSTSHPLLPSQVLSSLRHRPWVLWPAAVLLPLTVRSPTLPSTVVDLGRLLILPLSLPLVLMGLVPSLS
jgi:hypothetical protein